MRILVLGSIPESLINFRGPMLRAMVACGHEVIACSPAASAEIIDQLANLGVSYRDIELDRTGICPINDIRYVARLYRLLKRIKPDVFLSYTVKPVIYGSIAARIVGVPRIYSIISGLGYAFTSNGIKARAVGILVRWLYTLSLRFNKTVFFQNPDNRRKFLESGIVNSSDRTVLVNGSGVDLSYYQPSSFPTMITFLLMARLIKEKGVYEYVEAARILKQRYPTVKCLLAGYIDTNPSAISKATLKNWIDSGCIEYLGYLTDVRPAIDVSSVYVLPSYYPEGVPHSILEAMAMGRPIITTDTPGCRETVQHGRNGLIVSEKNVSALVNSMEYFISKPESIHSMGIQSLQIVCDKFDVNKINALILRTMQLD